MNVRERFLNLFDHEQSAWFVEWLDAHDMSMRQLFFRCVFCFCAGHV